MKVIVGVRPLAGRLTDAHVKVGKYSARQISQKVKVNSSEFSSILKRYKERGSRGRIWKEE